jgi:hypothetical protein
MPKKWGIKVWCLADSSSKFVYNFDFYCGKMLKQKFKLWYLEEMQAHVIVMKLLQGLENKRHCIVMDNYFSSIGLFKDLALKQRTQLEQLGATALDFQKI